MARRTRLTIDTIPLFADDEELGEVILGFERRRQFKAIAATEERYGMPKFSEVWGGWFTPAVIGYLQHRYGWKTGGFAGGDRGVEGSFHGPRKGLRSSSEMKAIREDPNNKREFYREGRVRVRSADGISWIEDAKPTDPASWQKKGKLTPRT